MEPNYEIGMIGFHKNLGLYFEVKSIKQESHVIKGKSVGPTTVFIGNAVIGNVTSISSSVNRYHIVSLTPDKEGKIVELDMYKVGMEIMDFKFPNHDANRLKMVIGE